KSGLCHVNLAADFAHARRVFAAQLLWDVGECSHIRCDVLAFRAIAASCSACEATVLVAQRAGQAVDLRLGGEDDFLICGKTQKPAYPFNELSHFGIGERIAE